MEQTTQVEVDNAGWWQRLGFGVEETPPVVVAQAERRAGFEVMP